MTESHDKSTKSTVSESGKISCSEADNFLANFKEDSTFSAVSEKVKSPIRRRSFLGLSLWALAGIALPSFSAFANSADMKFRKSRLGRMITGVEKAYWDRTDSFDVKKELMRSAWEKKDFRQVRALSDSIRAMSIHAQSEEDNPGVPVSDSSHFSEVADLPAEWQKWANGWAYYKVLTILEKEGLEREMEPVEALLSFPADKVISLSREIRVARLDGQELKEITSQIFGEVRRGKDWLCKLLFLAGSGPEEKQVYLVFFGNPAAGLPEYTSDLVTTGEEYRLDIENKHFKVKLSRQTGQVERITLKRNHGLVLYPGGDGHGEPGNIDWSHDYMAAGSYQKFRIALWDECPDYEIVRGPVCTIVRKWGFPYSPVHTLYSPARLNIDVEYRFYSGLPYFHKIGHMKAAKEFEVGAIRDDEWVFPGNSLPGIIWIGPDGKVNIGPVAPDSVENLWGVGFFNKETSDSFIALYLAHSSNGVPIVHTGVPRTAFGKYHGQVWARYPFRSGPMPAGTVLYQKNAYVTVPFTSEEGPAIIENLRDKLKAPLIVQAGNLPAAITGGRSTGTLARDGETGKGQIFKKLLWEALQNCKDPQLYSSDISIVELGLVQDIKIDNDAVNVVLSMPHRGRPLASYFMYGSSSVQQGPGAGKSSLTIPEALSRVPGVKTVTMTQSWYPVWNSNYITDEGRRKLGI